MSFAAADALDLLDWKREVFALYDDPSWACPLAPAESRLPTAVGAGEQAPPE